VFATGRIQLEVCGHVLFSASKYSDLVFLVSIVRTLKTGNGSGLFGMLVDVLFGMLVDVNCYQGNISSGCIDICD
jgi:hypothetical protein